MRKLFAIRKSERGWAFTFGSRQVDVVGIGKENQRYFDSHDALVKKLDSLGIKPDEYNDDEEVES